MPRTYVVVRDRWKEGLGREEMCLLAHELSEPELIYLPEPLRSEALAEIGCVLEEGPRGLEVVSARDDDFGVLSWASDVVLPEVAA